MAGKVWEAFGSDTLESCVAAIRKIGRQKAYGESVANGKIWTRHAETGGLYAMREDSAATKYTATVNVQS
jgi:hypothetical protein